MPSKTLLLLLALTLTACAASAPDATPDAGDGGWVELGSDVVIDESILERVTPAPAEPQAMPQAEAQAALPFAYSLPAWAPDGFVLQDEVEVVQPASGLGYTSVSFTWLNAAEAALRLQVEQRAQDQPALGAAGSTEAITVNGQPATLLHTNRLGLERLVLTWPRGDLLYTLTVEAGAATADDLRRMAESVA